MTAFFYYFSLAPERILSSMAKNSEVSSWTAQVRPKYVIYTPKQGDEYPQTFHIGIAQGLC